MAQPPTGPYAADRVGQWGVVHEEMKTGTILVFGVCLAFACSHGPVAAPSAPLALGDPEEVMVAKLTALGATNITTQTRCVLTRAITGEQKTYWWQLPDKTIVGLLMAGRTQQTLKVYTIETSIPGLKIEDLSNWRSHILTRQDVQDIEH